MTTRPARAPGPASPDRGSPAPVDVLLWRARRLRDAGFPRRLADELAAARVDLHALLELVDRGCPPPLAARILSPSDTSAAG